jgi:D-glycerate 3-kinase
MRKLRCTAMDAVPPLPAADLIAARLRPGVRRPFVLGISGAQGSGKTTIARALAARFGCPALSLDDLYLDGAARQHLAETVHPLLRTRGVPGTHDVAAGLAAIDALGKGPTLLPRFDKARDEPGEPEWVAGPAEMLILEGWCLGARPQAEAELAAPINALERECDPDGSWRRWVNDRLAGDYQALWARIDQLVFLEAPDFGVVADWRIEQEHRAGGPMRDDQIREFVQYYERLTRHLLSHGAEWADIPLRLDPFRRAKIDMD